MDVKNSDPIFTDWSDQHTALWGTNPYGCSTACTRCRSSRVNRWRS